jgi:hypothetical protein
MGNGIRGEILISRISNKTIKGKPLRSMRDLIIILRNELNEESLLIFFQSFKHNNFLKCRSFSGASSFKVRRYSKKYDSVIEKIKAKKMINTINTMGFAGFDP